MPIRIKLNGTDRSVEEGVTVSGILELCDVRPGGVVVERNRSILDRDSFSQVVLEDGDEIELIRFVGGG